MLRNNRKKAKLVLSKSKKDYSKTISSILTQLNSNSDSTDIQKKFNLTQDQESILNDPSFWKKFSDKVIHDYKSNLKVQEQEIDQKSKLITESIEYAKTIQEAILTSNEYFTSIFSDHFVYYQPKDIVSGDFYWAFKTKSNKLFWCTADCTGHGVPGAFMTMIGNSLLNEIIIENEVEETNLILDKLRDSVIKTMNKSRDRSNDTKNDNGMDIALCCWDLNTNNLYFSGAHSSVLIIRDGELTQIKGDRQPIGLHRKMEPFNSSKFQLQKGDRLYTSSDGYTDQLSEADAKRFSFTKLKELLLEIHSLPMEQQKSALHKEHLKWRGKIEQIDDIVIVGIVVS
jgi:sigma-B regulation protein RsbU (phosphoserine phosphatase)